MVFLIKYNTAAVTATWAANIDIGRSVSSNIIVTVTATKTLFLKGQY